MYWVFKRSELTIDHLEVEKLERKFDSGVTRLMQPEMLIMFCFKVKKLILATRSENVQN